MLEVLFVFCKVIELLLSTVTACMMLRAIVPLFMDVEESRWFLFVTFVTECFVAPVRVVFYKLNIAQDAPIDLSFFFTYLLLVIVQGFLPVL